MSKLVLALLISLIFLCFAVLSYGQPFLICDPQSDVVAYSVKWTPTDTWQVVPAETDTRVRYDLQSLAPGNYPNAEIRAGRQYMLNGQPQDAYVWGPSRPFALGKPVIPGTVADIVLEAPM